MLLGAKIGEVWRNEGDILEIDDWEAEQMIRRGAAEEVKEEFGEKPWESLSETGPIAFIKVDDIEVPEARLSSSFEPEELENLNVSIEKRGMGQPIVVFQDYSGRYWLADGYHRLQAVKKLGGKLIPAFVKYGDEESAITYGAMLNIQRGKVNPADLALFCKHLRDKCRITAENIAARLKISKAYVAQLLALAENSELLSKVKSGEISFHRARSLLYGKTGAETISEEKAATQERAEIYAPLGKAETEALSEKGGKIEEISLPGKPISEEKASFAERGEIQAISKEPKIEAVSAEKPIKAEIAEAPEKAVQPKSVETATREAPRLTKTYPKELVDLAVEVAGGPVETSAVEKALRQLMDLLWQRISEDPVLMNWVRSKLAELLQKHA